MSCVSSTFCVAVGSYQQVNSYTAAIAMFNGSGWTLQPPGIDDATMTAVSCASTTFCVALDSFGRAVTYNGAAGRRSSTSCTAAPTRLQPRDCPAPARPSAPSPPAPAGHTFNGSGWSPPTQVSAGGNLGAVACTSSTNCAAIASQGYWARFNGTTWTLSHPPRYPGWGPTDSLSCPTSSFCAAAGGDLPGVLATYDGQTWTAAEPTDVPATNPASEPRSVACASLSFCASVYGEYAKIWS